MVSAHVCILMATFNGARYLPQQLESFVDQTHKTWSLRIRDDGSQDDTMQLVQDFIRAYPERDIARVPGAPRRSSAGNFMALLETADWPAGAFVALSDQDDVWMPHRLERALEQIQGACGEQALGIYASRTVLTDAAGQPTGPSRRHPRAPAFANALVQNVLAGNTMVMTPASAELARHTAPAALAHGVPHHDWWLYQLLSGAGACIVQDDRPGLYYRQHDNNLLGANRGFGRGFSRFAMLLKQDYAHWIDANLRALQEVGDLLTPEARDLVDRFADWRAGGAARGGLRDLGLWRQTRLGDGLLALSARLGRL